MLTVDVYMQLMSGLYWLPICTCSLCLVNVDWWRVPVAYVLFYVDWLRVPVSYVIYVDWRRVLVAYVWFMLTGDVDL